MAYYFVAGIAIFIFALGLEADGQLPVSKEASYPKLDSADIESLKKIVAVLEAAVRQDAYAQQVNTQRYQQLPLASTYSGSVQGPSRYNEEMINEQQAEKRFYDKLKAIVASNRPGSGGGGSFGGGR